MKQAFSISGALIWNSIPLSIKTQKNQFKSKLNRKLFEILVKEDDYIRVSDITGQFSKSLHGVLPYEVQSAFLSDSGYKPHNKLDCF